MVFSMGHFIVAFSLGFSIKVYRYDAPFSKVAGHGLRLQLVPFINHQHSNGEAS